MKNHKKNTPMKNLYVIILCLLMLSCKQKNNEENGIVEVKKIPPEGLVLNKWYSVGPFPENEQTNFIDTNNLKLVGLNEDDFNFDEFIGITSKEQVSDSTKLDSNFTCTFHFSGDKPVNLDEFYTVNTSKYKGNAYFACIIRCRKDIETRLHFSSSDGQKIWLNNELICKVDQPKPVSSYEQYLPIKLRKGNNTLLIKVHKIDWLWEMYARLENTNETGLKRHFRLHNHLILQHTITFDSDSNYLDIFFPKCNGELTIYDSKESLILKDTIQESKKWSMDMRSLPKGLYKAFFKTGKIKLEQDIYKGNIHDTIQAIIEVLEKTTIREKNKDELEALLYRYNFLQSNTYRSDKKYVYIFKQFNNLLQGINKGMNPYKGAKGWYIRSYISDIDDSKQYYIIHVPRTYTSDQAMPLGIIVPAIINKKPYLESLRLGNTILVEFFQDMAEKYNIIIIEPASRRYSRISRNTVEEAELFNIINDVAVDYNLDNKRFYLAGTCSGGNEVLRLATEFPDKFAAIGMVSPEIIYPNFPNNRPYFRHHYPSETIENLSNIPIYNAHSMIDRHVDFKRSEVLDLMLKEGKFKNYKFDRLPNEFPKYYPDDFFDNILEHCTKFSLNLSPKEVHFSTFHNIYNKAYWITIECKDSLGKASIQAKIKGNKLEIDKENISSYTIDLKTLPYKSGKELKVVDNGVVVYKGMPSDSILFVGNRPKTSLITKNAVIAGPFSHVFGQRFIVVKGSEGTPIEKENINAIADTIDDFWYDQFYAHCIVKYDYEINNDDIESANLILLGNYNSNSILKSIKGKIPLYIGEDSIQIGKELIHGKELGFYMVYPNPINTKRYIAMIGYNHPWYFSLGQEPGVNKDITNYGWNDYKIWKARKPELIWTSGYFNKHWETE